MAAHIRYLRRQRNGIFEYHRRVPTAIVRDRPLHQRLFDGRRLFRRSLGTRSQSLAMQAAVTVHDEFERLIAETSEIAPPTGAALSDRNTRPLTEGFLRRVKANATRLVVDRWQRMKIRAESSPSDREELERLSYEREMFAEDLREALYGFGDSDNVKMPNIRENASRAIDDDLIDAPPGSEAFDLVCRAVREGLIEGEKNVDDILEDSASVFPAPGTINSVRPPLLSEVVAEHSEYLTKKRSLAELSNAFSTFNSLHGDLRLDELKRHHFLDYCRSEGHRTVGGKDKDSVCRPVSASTLKKKIGLLRASINRAIQTGWYEGANPASNIDVTMFARPSQRHLMPDKRPLEVQEINAVLRHPWFTGCASEKNTHRPGAHRLVGMHFWAPVLALYTGCRAGELGGLKLSEVRLDDQYPHILIADNEFRTTKGGYSRKVPVLDALISLGFADFVERARRQGSVRVFSDWAPPRGSVDPNATAWSNGAMLRSFNRTVVPQALGDRLADGARREVTFHSFRGAFKTMLQRKRWNLPTNYINEVVGHAKDALDQRYVKKIPISETYSAMRHCNYEGIELPTAP